MPRTMRRTIRGTLAVTATMALFGGVAACTENSDAARVGDDTITIKQLDSVVDEGLADPDLGPVAEDTLPEYRKAALSMLVQQKFFDQVAEHFDLSFTDAEVDEVEAQIFEATKQQLGLDPNAEPRALIQALAEQGQFVTESDLRIISEATLIQQLVGEQSGADTSAAAGEQATQQLTQQQTNYELGLIAVADEATAQDVAVQLEQNPADYPNVATQYPSPNTVPQPQNVTGEQLAQLMPELAQNVPVTPAGQAFSFALPADAGAAPGEAYAVVLVSSVSEPAPADIQQQVDSQLANQAIDAGLTEIKQFAESVDVWVNPRYGAVGTDSNGLPTIEDAPDNGVVKVLESSSPPSLPTTPNGATG